MAQGSDSDDWPMVGEVTRAALAIEEDGPSRYIDEEIKSPGEFSHQGA
jgi:hypothetical protein